MKDYTLLFMDVIFVNFRGTYSAATARIYSKLRSAKPVKLSDEVGVLYGIYKATCQLMHTIIEIISFFSELFQRISVLFSVFLK